MGRDYSAELRRENEAHQTKLRQSLERNKEILENRIMLCADPKDAVESIFHLAMTNIRLSKAEISMDDLSPDEVLAALFTTETWYKHRNFPYPNSEWLEEQRAYWKQQRGDKR